MIDYKQINWWYWFGTACLVTAGVAGYKIGFVLAIGLSLVQLIHFTLREQSMTAFPVQVRFWVLVYMLAAYPEPMQIAYWVPVVGTWARAIFGYCVMARTVSLLPWNRRVPFSAGLLRRTFLSRPVRGNIMQGLPPLPQIAGRA
ncbi:MAG TPA: hypothetical protein VNE59_15615 [Burkholderiales bacterium]|nr:hypothetical protein [Burkholderiales bacterium]